MSEPLDHDAEAAQQAAIAASVEEAKQAIPETPGVKLRSVNVVFYPLHVSVVGADALTFDDASATITVDAEVAEQVRYLDNVEVVA